MNGATPQPTQLTSPYDMRAITEARYHRQYQATRALNLLSTLFSEAGSFALKAQQAGARVTSAIEIDAEDMAATLAMLRDEVDINDCSVSVGYYNQLSNQLSNQVSSDLQTALNAASASNVKNKPNAALNEVAAPLV